MLGHIHIEDDKRTECVAFHTLGCKLNFSESSAIRQLFESKGYRTVSFGEVADIYIINTCSVTDMADKKCRKVVQRSRRNNPNAKIVIMGCYAQLKPQEIAEIPGVDLVVGAAEKFRILDLIEELGQATNYGHGLIRVSPISQANSFSGAFSIGDRTRSYLKVQDGCDYKCSFCTIPMARGRSRSDSVSALVERARKIGKAGAKEIVLTGVNIGDFGKDGNKSSKQEHFIDLIRALDELSELSRFRISSIEPNLLTDEIIEFVANSQRFMPHFHIPLQSGNNKQLRQMRRRYRRELYADRVAKIKSLMPHCCIGVDVIVGFPDETDEDFLESYRFIEALDVSYLHVFTYSERPYTPAIDMDGVVSINKRRKRNELLRNLSTKKLNNFYHSQIGKRHHVLLEQEYDAEHLCGHTENYIKLKLPRIDEGVQTNGIRAVVLTKEMLVL